MDDKKKVYDNLKIINLYCLALDFGTITQQ